MPRLPNDLPPPTPLDQLQVKLGLLLAVMTRKELASSLGMNVSTLRRIINDNHMPKQFTEADLHDVWRRYYKRRMRWQTDDGVIGEVERKALAIIGSHIDPQFLKFSPITNKLQGNKGRATVTDLVYTYINNHNIRGETITIKEIVDHFQSKEFADRHGVRINSSTTRAAIRRALGREPAFADTVTKATRGRKTGSRVLHGKTYRPDSKAIKAAAHLLED